MNSYGIRIVVPEGKVKEILDRLTAAQETINDCYQELRDLGVLVMRKRPPAATDGLSQNHSACSSS